MIRSNQSYDEIKVFLLDKLKEENALWSYDNDKIEANDISDEQLIALTMRYLDLEEITLLYKIFSARKIKKVWKNQLVPEGEYLYTLNRFFAWYYFKAKNPDSYLKSLQTRHLHSLQ